VVFGAVAGILATVESIFDAIANAALVTRIDAILHAIPHVFTPVTAIFRAVTVIFTTVTDVLDTVTHDGAIAGGRLLRGHC
jgi:hypothetical protein